MPTPVPPPSASIAPPSRRDRLGSRSSGGDGKQPFNAKACQARGMANDMGTQKTRKRRTGDRRTAGLTQRRQGGNLLECGGWTALWIEQPKQPFSTTEGRRERADLTTDEHACPPVAEMDTDGDRRGHHPIFNFQVAGCTSGMLFSSNNDQGTTNHEPGIRQHSRRDEFFVGLSGIPSMTSNILQRKWSSPKDP